MGDVSINSTTSAESHSGLLLVPLEIRRLVYGHFLNANQLIRGTSYTTDEPAFDLRPFWICRQIRREAFEYFVASNQWICFADYGLPHDISKPLETSKLPMKFPAVLPTHDRNDLLASHVDLTVRIGHGCGSAKPSQHKPLSMSIFAVTTETWIMFCRVLGSGVDKYRYISVDIALRHHANWKHLFPHLLVYLAIIRTANRVRFTCMMHEPVFKRMKQVMTQSFGKPDDWHDYLKGILECASLCDKQGLIMAASAVLGVGVCTLLRLQELMTGENTYAILASDETTLATTNTMYSYFSDIRLTHADFLHKVCLARLKTGTAEEARSTLSSYKAIVEFLMPWAGMSPEQRRRAHLHEAQLSMLKFDYLKTKVDSKQADCLRFYDPCYQSNSNEELLERAACHYFYAAELDETKDNAARKVLSDIKKLLPYKIDPEIDTCNFPGIGEWKGDLDFWRRFHPDLNRTMVLYAKREDHSSTEEQLQTMKKELGIQDVDLEAGLLRLLA